MDLNVAVGTVDLGMLLKVLLNKVGGMANTLV